jgi:four helix bundle protein
MDNALSIADMGSGVDRFTNLRAWQACNVYKKAIYGLCEEPPLADDWKRRGQLEESVRGPGAHLAEGYGRFNPPDFARFAVMARASLMESQNHLLDLVDRGYISDERRVALNALAEAALEQVTGLLEYLQSPEALRNARRARERRIATRPDRRTQNLEPRTQNLEPRTQNLEPRTRNSESRTQNSEPRTQNSEPRTQNSEPRTQNSEPRTQTTAPGTQNAEPNSEPEPRSENSEG